MLIKNQKSNNEKPDKNLKLTYFFSVKMAMYNLEVPPLSNKNPNTYIIALD